MPSTTPNQPAVNLKQCLKEAKIIGYLIGRKISKKDPKYVPEDMAHYHTLPLRGLNRVAQQACAAFLNLP